MASVDGRSRPNGRIPWVCPHCYALIAQNAEQEEAYKLYLIHLKGAHSARPVQPESVALSSLPVRTEPTASLDSQVVAVSSPSHRVLVQCPICTAKVRPDRLDRHRRKVHGKKQPTSSVGNRRRAKKTRRKKGGSWLFRENRAIHKLPPLHSSSSTESDQWEREMTMPNTEFWRSGRRR